MSFLSNNILIYRKIGRDHWMRLFVFDQRLRLNTDLWIVVFKLHPFDLHGTIEMSPCVYRGAFNLDRYNSPNEQLRLNHLTMNRCLMRCSHVPPQVSEIRRSWLNRSIRRVSLRHVTCKLKQKGIAPHDINSGFLRVYLVHEMNGLAKIHNGCVTH